MLEAMQRWWTRKYSLPWNHDLFQERTLFDLMVEYNLDFFAENPLEVHRNEDGHIQFKNTGDDLIDKWEEQIARGETPNMAQDMFDEEALEKLERLRARGRARTGGLRAGGGGSMKDVFEEVARDAMRQGLEAPGRVSLPKGQIPGRWQRSSFGDGADD